MGVSHRYLKYLNTDGEISQKHAQRATPCGHLGKRSLSRGSFNEMPAAKVLEMLGYLGTLEYLYIHNEISWGGDPDVNMKLIRVSQTP